jgi:hypothetical protein
MSSRISAPWRSSDRNVAHAVAVFTRLYGACNTPAPTPKGKLCWTVLTNHWSRGGLYRQDAP